MPDSEIDRQRTERETRPFVHIHADAGWVSIGFLDAHGVPVRGDTLLQLPAPHPSSQSDHSVALRWFQAVAELLPDGRD